MRRRLATSLAFFLFLPLQARADTGDCGQPVSPGPGPVASDALHVLRTSVGSATCPLCVCDVNGDDKIFATDALLTLRKAVGSPVNLSCRTCFPLTAHVELNPDPVKAGETLLATVHVGSFVEPVEDVAVSIEIPPSIAPFAASAASGAPVTCSTEVSASAELCSPGETITWTPGDLSGSVELVLTVPLVIAAGQPNGTIVEIEAVAAAPAILPAEASAAAEIDSTAHLDLALSSRESPVSPESIVTWTVSLANQAATASSSGTVLRVSLPEGTSFFDATGGGVPNETGEVVWEIGTLAAGQHAVREVRVEVGDAVEDGSVLAARATLENEAGETVTAQMLLSVRSDPPIRLALEAGPDPVRPGETATSVLHVTGASGDPSTPIEVEVYVPTEVQDFFAVVATGAPALCTANISNSTGVCSPRERLVWNGTIEGGGGATLTLPAPIKAATPGGTLTTFEVRARTAAGTVAATRRSLRLATPDVLDLSIAADADPAAPGAELAHTITFSNPSTMPVTGATLTMNVPAGTSFVEASAGGTEDDGVVQWAIGSIGAGDGGTRQALFEVDSGTGDGALLSARAVLTSNEGADERAGVDIRTSTASPIAFDIGFTSQAIAVGGTVAMQMHLVNETGAQLSGVAVDVFLPAEVLAFAHGNLAGALASCGSNVSVSSLNCAPGELATWQVGNLSAGAEANLTMSAPIQGSVPAGTIVTFEARARVGAAVHGALRGDVRIAD